MKSYETRIKAITEIAIQKAAQQNACFVGDYLCPDNWEIKCTQVDGKKHYTVWNKKYSIDWNEIFPGSSPEEALKKWVEDLFHGKESLDSIRLSAAISGIPWEEEKDDSSGES